MRIISPFHDYYDCCQDASDKTNIYLRATEKGEVPYWGGEKKGFYRTEEPQLYMFLIGFCGKMYPVCRFTYQKEKVDMYIHTLDKLQEICNKYEKECRGTRWYKSDKYTHVYDNILSLFGKDRFEEVTRGYHKLFFKYHTPIFVLQHKKSFHTPIMTKYTSTIEINARLGDYGFAKVFPPHLAVQEIEMYLFGVLGAQTREKIPVVSNNDLIESKGFDLKKSFRKRKAAK